MQLNSTTLGNTLLQSINQASPFDYAFSRHSLNLVSTLRYMPVNRQALYYRIRLLHTYTNRGVSENNEDETLRYFI